MKHMGRINEKGEVPIPRLDAKDRQILSLLSEDSRLPLTQISKKIRLSRDSVDYRIKRMQKNGIILGFFPIINLQLFKYSTFHVFMLMDELDRQKQKALISELKECPYVKSLMEYSDRWDLEVVFVARTVQEFDEVLTEIVSKYSDLILEKEKLQIIKGYNSIHLPNTYIQREDDFPCITKEHIQKVDCDDKDILLLQMLSEDARLSTYKLGGKLGLSADAIIYRIKKLIKSNVIRKFTIMVNLTLLGYEWYTFCVQMKMFDKKNESMFKTFIEKHPYIMRAVKTLGAWDLMLNIVTESPRNFHKTVKQIKKHFSSIIKNYTTWLAYKEYYYDPFPDIIAVSKLYK